MAHRGGAGASLAVGALVDQFAASMQEASSAPGAGTRVFGFRVGEPEFRHLETVIGVGPRPEVAESLTEWCKRKGGPGRLWTEDEFWEAVVPALLRIIHESLQAKGHAPRMLQKAKDHSQINPVATFAANILLGLDAMRRQCEPNSSDVAAQSRNWMTRVRAYKREVLWNKFFNVYTCVRTSQCDQHNVVPDRQMALVGAIKSGIEECNMEGSLQRLAVCEIVVQKVLRASASGHLVEQSTTPRIDQEDTLAGAIIRTLTRRHPLWPGLGNDLEMSDSACTLPRDKPSCSPAKSCHDRKTGPPTRNDASAPLRNVTAPRSHRDAGNICKGPSGSAENAEWVGASISAVEASEDVWFGDLPWNAAPVDPSAGGGEWGW